MPVLRLVIHCYTFNSVFDLLSVFSALLSVYFSLLSVYFSLLSVFVCLLSVISTSGFTWNGMKEAMLVLVDSAE